MMPEHSANLSPYFTCFEPDINLRIYLDHMNTFSIDIRVSGVRPQRIHTGLTREDVAALNQEIQEAIEQSFCQDGPIDDETISPLLHTGLAAFHRIFPRGVPRETIQRALELVSKKSLPVIEITSDHFFIPWEILSSDPMSVSNIRSFWGMHYILSRTLVQDDHPGNMVLPIMQTTRPCVGLITCNPEELTAVHQIEIPALQALHQQKQITLSQLRPLNARSHQKELVYFGQFLREEIHIAHFACHAYREDPPALSYLRISNGFHVTMTDFFAEEFETSYHPFIILNACNTSIPNPLSTANWAMLFWKYGARGVLATEFHVPDTFAAVFIEELYRHFLIGKPIGEALQLARKTLWEESHMPYGLAYALYSPAEIQIVP